MFVNSVCVCVCVLRLFSDSVMQDESIIFFFMSMTYVISHRHKKKIIDS